MPIVKELMTKNPKTCKSQEALPNLLKIMRQEDAGIVPVMDESNHVTGIITDRDVVLYLANHPDQRPDEIKITDLIAKRKELITVQPDTEIHQAIDLMKRHQVRRLIVQDAQGRCVGLLSQSDIARHGLPEIKELVQAISQPNKQTVGANR